MPAKQNIDNLKKISDNFMILAPIWKKLLSAGELGDMVLTVRDQRVINAKKEPNVVAWRQFIKQDLDGNPSRLMSKIGVEGLIEIYLKINKRLNDPWIVPLLEGELKNDPHLKEAMASLDKLVVDIQEQKKIPRARP